MIMEKKGSMETLKSPGTGAAEEDVLKAVDAEKGSLSQPLDEGLVKQKDNNAEAMAAPEESNASPGTIITFIILNIFVIGLVQLLGWAGQGQKDPWVNGMNVLQMAAVLASGIQIIFFIPAFIYQTEKYYDIVGTLTYMTCLAYSFAGGHVQAHQRLGIRLDVRAILATCFVAIWSFRLGTFLFRRILSSKKDGRFDNLKPSFVKFFFVWNTQGLWVFAGCLPTFIVNSTQSGRGFYWTDVVGGLLFIVGLIGEIVADEQKKAFNGDPANKGKWINVGLWKYSRHPNYFCEWLLQFGLFVFCCSEFSGSQWVAVISPVTIAVLLAFVSGVPLLEQRADQKWGGNADYERYKKRTSICLPLPPLNEDRRGIIQCMPSFLV